MKILHIDCGLDYRGGQKQAKILHLGLLERGIESHFLLNKDGILKKHNLLNSIDFDYRGEFSLKSHLFFRKVIKSLKPDIVQTHDGHSLIFGAFFKNFGYRLVQTRRVSYQISYLSRVLKYNKADLHVAVSKEIQEYLKNYFSNVVLINSCIEVDKFNNDKKSVLKDKAKYNILFVGAFSKQKGVEVLINAFNKINNKDIKLHLVGSGANLDSMKSIANNRAVFYGQKENVKDFYYEADLIVVPSVDGEGSSGVIKEAMACGRVVLASDLKANQEIIKNGFNGVLFKNQDSNDLQNKIMDIFLNKININQNNIKNTILNYDCKNLIRQYINEYKKLKI